MKKRCSKCREMKPLSEFHKRGEKRHDTYCKLCRAAYHQAHYQANKAKYRAKARAWEVVIRKENRDYIIAYFADHPCVDCGEDDPLVLDFDHRDMKAKSYGISRMIREFRLAKLIKEIEKCDVRCANCHRRKSAREMGWWKALLSPLA